MASPFFAVQWGNEEEERGNGEKGKGKRGKGKGACSACEMFAARFYLMSSS